MASYFSEAQVASLYGGKEAANRAFADLRERYLVVSAVVVENRTLEGVTEVATGLAG